MDDEDFEDNLNFDEDGEENSENEYGSEPDDEQIYGNKIENLERKLDENNTNFEENKLDIVEYNRRLIEIQMNISTEKINELKLENNNNISDNLVIKLDSLFEDLNKLVKKSKLDPLLITETIDDIFRRYGEVLEFEDFNEFEESNPIESNIHNIINLPIPEKYQKDFQLHEQRITQNNISPDEIDTYFNIRLNILRDNLETNLKNDIFFSKFNIELGIEFITIRIEVNEFKKGTDIKKFLDKRIEEFVGRYKNKQESLFKKKDSDELIKIFKQLSEIYIKDDFLKIKRRFTNKEIINDFKNEPLDIIIEKYSQYISSSYFDWASSKKEPKDENKEKIFKNSKISEKDINFIKIAEKREYTQRRKLEIILNNLPDGILLKCAEKFIQEGKIPQPYLKYTPQDIYINDLYDKAREVWTFSSNYPVNVTKYTESESVKKLMNDFSVSIDAFSINKSIIQSYWDIGPKLEIGDTVHVDRVNKDRREILKEIRKLGKSKKPESIRKKVILELKLKSYNTYMKTAPFRGVVVSINNEDNTVKVRMENGATQSIIKTCPISYTSTYLKPEKKKMPLYLVAKSNAFDPIDKFDPSAELNDSSIYPVIKWIKCILGIKKIDNSYSKENLITLYDEALEEYKKLTKIDKEKIDKKVLYNLPNRLKIQFNKGIPSKNPLMFEYPPILPEISDNVHEQDAQFAEFNEYSRKLQQYVENLTPETNPYVNVGVLVPNPLVEDIAKKTFVNLSDAIKHTPVNGFFKLSSLNKPPKLNIPIIISEEDFDSLVFNYMNKQELSDLQKILMTNEQIKEYDELFYKREKDREDKSKNYSENKPVVYKSIANPKIILVDELKLITDPEQYIKSVKNIDKNVHITKVVGEEVFIGDTSKPINKISLEKMIISNLTKESQTQSEIPIINKKIDPIVESIKTMLIDSTFQLLDLSKRISGSLIVHTKPTKYRIKLVDYGKINKGWRINVYKEINELKEDENNYKFDYPLIIIDFTKYLILLRNNLSIKYENFRKLDILNYDEVASSKYIHRQIIYITNYLKDIGVKENFNLKLIKQQDENAKIRLDEKHKIVKALEFMSKGILYSDKLKDIATDIEEEIFNSFQDIKNGTFKKGEIPSNILKTNNTEHFELIKSFKRSNLPLQAIYPRPKDRYGYYHMKTSIAIFNIYRTNDFIKKYLDGSIQLSSIIDRDLTKEEMNEEIDTVENLMKWRPNVGILNSMKKEYPVAYKKYITNAPSQIDVSIMNLFENETVKMSTLNKKLALIELVKYKSWKTTLKNVKKIPEENKLMYLIKHRNSLRSINNITSEIRLNTLYKLYISIKHCGITENDKLNAISENIETACFSLSNNEFEYNQIINNILSSKSKLCKMISEFSISSSAVDIIVWIADLYLEFGKYKENANILKQAKLGDWDGIRGLPNELLLGIKKVANSLVEIKPEFRTILRSEKEKDNKGNIYWTQKLIKNEEFRIVKDKDGKFTVNQIDIPIVMDENKKISDMFLKVIKYNYIPRLNNILSTEIQKIIDKNELSEQIIDELGAKNVINKKDIEKLKSFNYEKLLDIYSNFYREPTFVEVIPMSFAKKGIKVYPIKSRRGFLIGGNFPIDARSYRYRDENGNIQTRLGEICKWIGEKPEKMEYPENSDIYFKYTYNSEMVMMECVKKLIGSELWVKIHNDELINSKEVLARVIADFDMHKFVEESVIKYFNEFGGNKALFVNGGTKEEFDSFMSNTMYIEALQKLLGVSTLIVPKKVYNPDITVDDRTKISVLKNGDNTIYRKLYKSTTQTYPVPIRYNSENYPIYSNKQKLLLAFLIENGYMSPWYQQKIKIIKTDRDIKFEGDLPFIIDENDNDNASESNYYVEQVFKDGMYGLPIVTRIGIFPKTIKGAEGQHIIKKMKMAENKYSIKEEQFKIKFFKSELPSQSHINEFRMNDAQKPMKLSAKDLSKKSGYSIIDSRMLTSNIKYNPEDVWSWDPLTDYKVGAEKDNDIWTFEKNKQMSILKDWLKKSGSSSSAFIAAKNEATRFLQIFRVNLPSQIKNTESNEIIKFKKPIKSFKDIVVIKIKKAWKKYSKDELINVANKINYYHSDMDKMENNKILKDMINSLEQEPEIELNNIANISNIDLTKEDDIENAIVMSENTTNYSFYISKFIKNKSIKISPEVMEIIRNPKKIFQNYNRYKIIFTENGIEHVPMYNDENINETVTTETIYEILKNMSFTTNFGFNEKIINYINDIELFEQLDDKNKLKIMSDYPIMKIIFKIKKSGLKLSIWNILMVAQNTWYPIIQKGMQPDKIDTIKNKTLKYSFENIIEITVEDTRYSDEMLII